MKLNITTTECCQIYGQTVKIHTFNSIAYHYQWWFKVGEYKSPILKATTREEKHIIVRQFLEEQATPKATIKQ